MDGFDHEDGWRRQRPVGTGGGLSSVGDERGGQRCGSRKQCTSTRCGCRNIAYKGMYNGSILRVLCRINDEVDEREIIREDLSYLI